MSYILVIENDRDDPMELPCEDDGSLLLSTLIAQFPEATGLKYKNPETGAFRGIRLNDGRLYSPTESGWGNEKYHVVFPKAIENKRKLEEEEFPPQKSKKLDVKTKCTDLIALGIPWKTTDETLRQYFEKFGEVVMCTVKLDQKTGKSKGFGFVRFKAPESQLRVLAQRHNIDGRWCEVQIPNSKEGIIKQAPSKVFVGRITEDMSVEDIKEYFTTFGEVTDVYIPKPFRSFCFVTFLDPDSTEKLWEEDHVIKGITVHVSDATPKTNNKYQQGGNNQGGYGGNYGNKGGYNDYDNYGGGGGNDRGFGSNNGGGGGGGNYRNRNNYNDRGNNFGGRNDFGGGNRGSGGSNYRNSNNMDVNAPPSSAMNMPALPPAIVAAALNQWSLMGGGVGAGSLGSENGSSNYGAKSVPSTGGGGGFEKSYGARDKYDYGKSQNTYDQDDYAPPPRNNYNNYNRR